MVFTSRSRRVSEVSVRPFTRTVVRTSRDPPSSRVSVVKKGLAATCSRGLRSQIRSVCSSASCSNGCHVGAL